MEKFLCKCGFDIQKEDIEFKNGTNEEGEEYCDLYFKCSSCGLEIEANQWGECTNSQDSIERVSDEIQSSLMKKIDENSSKLSFMVIGGAGIGKSFKTI